LHRGISTPPHYAVEIRSDAAYLMNCGEGASGIVHASDEARGSISTPTFRRFTATPCDHVGP